MKNTDIMMNDFENTPNLGFDERAKHIRMENEIKRSLNTFQLGEAPLPLDSVVDVDVKTIRIDGGIHSRAILNELIIDEYAAAMLRGDQFPAVVLFQDNLNLWLADGFHILQAALQAGAQTIRARIQYGDYRAAKLYAAHANIGHGLRRSNADKNRAVMFMLDDFEWCLWTDRQIADHCGVDNAFVSKLRQAAIEAFESQVANIETSPEETQQSVDNPQANTSKPTTPPTIHPQTRDLVRNTILADNLLEVQALAKRSLDQQKQIVKVIANGEAPSVLEAGRLLRSKKKTAKLKTRIDDVKNSGFNSLDFVQGDCREKLLQLSPKSVRLLLSDVPYGMGLKNKKRVASEDWKPIEGDKDLKTARALLRDMLAAINPAMKDECHALIFSDRRYPHLFCEDLTEAGYVVRDILVWVKNNHGVGYTGGFAPSYECIIHAVRGSAEISPRLNNSLCVAVENKTSHVCEKPTDLLSQLIGCTTVPGELVCDPFSGTGATLVAAAELGRAFFGVELEEQYHLEGLGRLQKLTEQGIRSANTYQGEEKAEVLAAA